MTSGSDPDVTPAAPPPSEARCAWRTPCRRPGHLQRPRARRQRLRVQVEVVLAAPVSRNTFPLVAAAVRVRLDEGPLDALVIFATSSLATAPETALPDTSVSWNFSGTVEPSLKMLDPSGLTGCCTPPYMYCTAVVHDALGVRPTLSVAVARRRLAARRCSCRSPSSRRVEARPDCASARRTSRSPCAFSRPPPGSRERRSLGFVASTWTPSVPGVRLVADVVGDRPADRVRAAGALRHRGRHRGRVHAGARAAVLQRRIAVVGERAGHGVQVPAAATRVVRARGRRSRVGAAGADLSTLTGSEAGEYAVVRPSAAVRALDAVRPRALALAASRRTPGSASSMPRRRRRDQSASSASRCCSV